MTNSSVAIVYHRGFGHTRVQAEAVRDGAAAVAGTTAPLIPVDDVDAHWEVLDDADAIIFGSPTYMAGASAGMNGDKLATLQQFALFAMQHGMVWVGLGLLPGNHTSDGSPDDLNRLAGFLGAMAQSNADQGADLMPPVADRRTAEHLGGRVAELAGRLRIAREALVDVA